MDALSSALAGMQNATWRFDVAATTIVAAEEQPSGVDLATELVSMLTARTTYSANARVAAAARETGRSLFDALG